MTSGSKARRAKKWLSAHEERTTPFSGATIMGLLSRLRVEQSGASTLRTPRHDLTYRQVMRFMHPFASMYDKQLRCEAYRMVLRRAWERLPMSCFDQELFDEMFTMFERLHAWGSPSLQWIGTPGNDNELDSQIVFDAYYDDGAFISSPADGYLDYTTATGLRFNGNSHKRLSFRDSTIAIRSDPGPMPSRLPESAPDVLFSKSQPLVNMVTP